jgi:hypothetical protein
MLPTCPRRPVGPEWADLREHTRCLVCRRIPVRPEARVVNPMA